MSRKNLVGIVVGLIASSLSAQWTNPAGTSNVILTNAGHLVGVGTTAPGEKLHVLGNLLVEGSYLRYSIAGDGSTFDLKGSAGYYGFGLRLKSHSSAGGNANRFFQIGRWDVNGVYAPLVHINDAGNVGIGTTTPNLPLVVAGNEQVGSFGTSSAAISVGGQNAFIGGYAYGGTSTLYLGANFLTDSQHGFYAPNPGDASALLYMQGGGLYVFSQAAGGNMFFNNYRFAISPAGNVSIADAPDALYKLYVKGDVRVDGKLVGTNVQANYQDVAEWVAVSEPVAAGMVMVIDSNARNGVAPSTQPYDTKVAGVVSAQPGVILGVASPEKAQVATTGRVKVRVDATQEPIHTGDLLVTSAKPGVAMKSIPIDIKGRKFHQPGTVIGKALEPLEAGEGEILVLLSLQ